MMILAAVFLFSIALIPQSASAAAVTLTNATTSSSNASSTLIKVGQTLSFQLNLSATPAATSSPVINIFGMGSTTMSGSGGAWTYSTTSVSAWTEGNVTFYMGWGGTVGEATTTFSSIASTTLSNVRFDKTAPSIVTTTIASNNASTTLAKVGDVVTLTFTTSEGISSPTVTMGAQTASVVGSGSAGTSWTASTTVTSSDTDSTALTFSLTPTDYAGNATSTAQTAVTSGARVVVDKSGPTISIAGSNPDSVYASTGSYSDAGATATDNVDSSATVSTSGTVTISTASSYTLTYTSTDTAGNTTTSTRTVTVKQHGSGGVMSGNVSAPQLPTSSNVQTEAQQISALQAQISSLLSLLASLTGTGTGGTPSANAYLNADANARFKRDLQVGSIGEDVKALQVWLNSKGYTVAASGAGSPGQETSKFGAATRAALAKYQKAEGISPAAGYFGAKTRAYIAANP